MYRPAPNQPIPVMDNLLAFQPRLPASAQPKRGSPDSEKLNYVFTYSRLQLVKGLSGAVLTRVYREYQEKPLEFEKSLLKNELQIFRKKALTESEFEEEDFELS